MAQLDISSSVVDASAFIIVGTSRLCKGNIKQLSHVFCSTNIFICISLFVSVTVNRADDHSACSFRLKRSWIITAGTFGVKEKYWLIIHDCLPPSEQADYHRQHSPSTRRAIRDPRPRQQLAAVLIIDPTSRGHSRRHIETLIEICTGKQGHAS